MNKEINPFETEFGLTTPDGALVATSVPGRPAFRVAKRGFDIVISLTGLVITTVMGIVLVALNPIWNRGPLFYSQIRMGRDCQPFRAYKFRTMRASNAIARGPNDPVETDRITPLGHFLRRTRLDEWPQFLNVLRGEMSFIGPRPDYWDHALHYAETVPGYRLRHMVRPGITGLAQVDGGYAEGVDATSTKTRIDLAYIKESGPAMDWYVFWRTVSVVLTGQGAR